MIKQLNLYKIREKAQYSGREVYSIQQLANLAERPKTIAKVYASRLVKKGLAKRLLRGKIAFTDDDYIIATQLIEPSYISLSSALLFHGLIQQVPVEVECVSTRNSFRFPKLGITYHKIPPSLFFGYEKHRKGNSYIFVAESEKALIDAVYLGKLNKTSAQVLLKKVDKRKVIQYLKRFKGRGKKKLERYFK